MISAQSGGGSGPTLTPPPSKPGSAAAAAAPVAPDVFSNQLKQAGKALDLEMGRDRLADLLDLLRKPQARHDLTKSGYGGDRSFKWPILDKEKNIPLPEILFEQYDLLQCKCFMGLFPEINRAWITIDHRLFLWNYEDGQDFYLFEDQDQVIVSVGLTRPTPGVFIEQIEYLLVVATPLEIILLGLAFSKSPSSSSENKKDIITLYNTTMSVPSDNISMTSIVGTDNGRIFMTGNNGHLYEMLYQAEEGWFTRKCRKLNHTSSAVSYFVPTFLKFSQDDPIVKIAIDETRNILYTLSDKSNIEVIHLGVDGKGFYKIAKMTDIINPTQKALESYPYSGYVDPRSFQICTIHIVPPSESNQINLVAITSTGCRLYFSCHPNYRAYGGSGGVGHQYPISSPPTTLRLVWVRPPPPSYSQDRSMNMGGAGGSSLIHVSHYSAGVMVGASPISEDVDCVIGVCPDMGAITQDSWCEMPSTIYIDGKTWAISEIPLHVLSGKTKKKSSRAIAEESGGGSVLNEFNTQLTQPTRKFLILTNSGVTVLSKKRPIDVLQQLVIDANSLITPIIRVFFDSVGVDQACAMCLAIACRHPSISTAPKNAVPFASSFSGSSALVSGARKLFFELGGRPMLKEQPRMYDVNSAEASGHLGMPLMTPDILYSGRHGGLALYLGRLLQPIWRVRILTKVPSPRGSSERIESNVDIQQLISVQRNLSSLNEFLNQTPYFTAAPNPSDIEKHRRGPINHTEESAHQAEQESLHNLHILLKQALEAIALVLLILDHNVTQLLQTIPGQHQKSIVELSYEGLVATTPGRGLGKILITALVTKQIDEQINVDVISDSLRDRCPSFCSPDDVVLYKGVECMQKAKTVSSMYEANDFLKESLRLFSLVSTQLSFEKVEEICENYKNLRFHAGAVELVLLYAQNQDPAGYALGYYNSGQFSNDQDIRADAFQKRRRCYDIIFSVILSIDNAMLASPQSPVGHGELPALNMEELENFRRNIFEVCLASEDELFHYCLYEWLIENTFTDQLLQIRSPFIEAYLQRERHVLEKADLLWQFYGKSGQFHKAARVLGDLAESDEYPIDLNKRIEYLSRAIANAKSSSGTRSDNSEYLHDLEERIEVAQVQQEVLSNAENSLETETADELNSKLLTISELYNQYVRPMQLHEVTLLILHTADHRDRPLVESTWNAIIKNTLEMSETSGRRRFDALGDKVKEIGSRFYPNDNTFPIRLLCNALEAATLQKHEQGDIGWAIKTMRSVGVSHNILFQIYHDLFETKLPPWQSTASITFLMQELCFLLHDWFDYIQQPSTPASERESFPAKAVDEAISKYLVTNIPNDTLGIISNLQTIQSRLRRRFA